jgi:hypothetical protein
MLNVRDVTRFERFSRRSSGELGKHFSHAGSPRCPGPARKRNIKCLSYGRCRMGWKCSIPDEADDVYGRIIATSEDQRDCGKEKE